jgi:hypothetical protein
MAKDLILSLFSKMNTTQSRLNYEISQLLLIYVKIKKGIDVDVKSSVTIMILRPQDKHLSVAVNYNSCSCTSQNLC